MSPSSNDAGSLSRSASSIIALDVGNKRVGVAIASRAARLSRPLTTLLRSGDFFNQLNEIIATNAVDMVVIGLPRNLEGLETAQSAEVRKFADNLRDKLNVNIEWQDETLTSVEAEKELSARGKAYEKSDIDSLAATLILEDYLEHQLPKGV